MEGKDMILLLNEKLHAYIIAMKEYLHAEMLQYSGSVILLFF